MNEISPAFQRRGAIRSCISPAGTTEYSYETFPEQRLFAWQKKYGAFSVSVSQLDAVMNYIQNQREHHRVRTFQEEFLDLLKKHRIEYDERYLWD